MSKKLLRRLLLLLATIIVVINVIAFNHAWRFTHYNPDVSHKTRYEGLTLADKIKYGFLGVDNPRPENKELPAEPYETIYINSNVRLECWTIKANNAKGTVMMFHGYTGDKAKMLDRAALIRDMGYNTMLVDMMGTGGSEGNKVTIGYQEAVNVKDCYDYLVKQGKQNIILYGISMGAAASMKAIKDYQLEPSCLIVEAPFGTMFNAVTNRFDLVGAPYFPMAHLLVMWGGLQHGFWAFSHQPQEYAKYISCPTLVMYGAEDDRVMIEEVETITENLKGKKKLIIYPEAGHVQFMGKYRDDWINDITNFLSAYSSQ